MFLPDANKRVSVGSWRGCEKMLWSSLEQIFRAFLRSAVLLSRRRWLRGSFVFNFFCGLARISSIYLCERRSNRCKRGGPLHVQALSGFLESWATGHSVAAAHLYVCILEPWRMRLLLLSLALAAEDDTLEDSSKMGYDVYEGESIEQLAQFH